jgi:hypothetical protein
MSVSETLVKLSIAGPFVQFAWNHLIIHERATVREIKEAGKIEDWWPVKTSLDYMKRLGLVEERDGVWGLTDFGRRVRKAQFAVRPLPEV